MDLKKIKQKTKEKTKRKSPIKMKISTGSNESIKELNSIEKINTGSKKYLIKKLLKSKDYIKTKKFKQSKSSTIRNSKFSEIMSEQSFKENKFKIKSSSDKMTDTKCFDLKLTKIDSIPNKSQSFSKIETVKLVQMKLKEDSLEKKNDTIMDNVKLDKIQISIKNTISTKMDSSKLDEIKLIPDNDKKDPFESKYKIVECFL